MGARASPAACCKPDPWGLSSPCECARGDCAGREKPLYTVAQELEPNCFTDYSEAPGNEAGVGEVRRDAVLEGGRARVGRRNERSGERIGRKG